MNVVTNIPEPDNAGAQQLGSVVALLAAGQRDDAERTLAGQTRLTLVMEPLELSPTAPRTGWAPGNGSLTGVPTKAVTATVYLRDEFTCRYCVRWTIPTQILRLVSEALPDQFRLPELVQGRRSTRLLGHLHHNRPRQGVSRGGDRHDPENLATACARCQYQKNNLSLETLGWSVRRTWAGWSGLIEHYEPL
jgi:5-methylcytosine-specific restriction endonuclease McrA